MAKEVLASCYQSNKILEFVNGELVWQFNSSDRFFPVPTGIQKLENEIAQISAKREEEELAQLIAEADAEAKAPESETKPEERTFLWGALALQKLNPEISVSGDFVAGLIIVNIFKESMFL